MWNSTTFLVEGAFRMSHRISSELPLETSGRLAATGSGVVVVVEEHIVVGLAVRRTNASCWLHRRDRRTCSCRRTLLAEGSL